MAPRFVLAAILSAGALFATQPDACVQFLESAQAHVREGAPAPSEALAKARYRLLAERLKTDPSKAAGCLLDQATREALPDSLSGYLERDFVETGNLDTLYEDWPDETGERILRGRVRELLVSGGWRYELHRLRAPRASDGRVSVRGIAIGDEVLVLQQDAVPQSTPSRKGNQRALQYSDGTKTVLFLRMDFSDLPGNQSH